MQRMLIDTSVGPMSFQETTAELDKFKYNENIEALAEIASRVKFPKYHYTAQKLAGARLIELLAIKITCLPEALFKSIEAIPNEEIPERIIEMLWGKPIQLTYYLYDQSFLVNLCATISTIILTQRSLRAADTAEGILIPVLTQGPLKKNQATTLLEHIYRESQRADFKCEKDHANHHIATIGQHQYHLSLLLQEADFSQFRIVTSESKEEEASSLTIEEKAVIKAFTFQEYIKINETLRHGTFQGWSDLKNALLMVNAINKLCSAESTELANLFEQAKNAYDNTQPVLQSLDAIKQYALANNMMSLEQFNRHVEAVYTGSYRHAKMVPADLRTHQGFMSSSRATEWEENRKDYIVWSHKNTSIRGLALESMDKEAEVLHRANQLFFFLNTKDAILALPVNTPLLEKPTRYFQYYALYVAYHSHLKHAMKETHLCSTDINFQFNYKIVEKPNHGLAHTIRTMTYVDDIIEYFKNYACHKGFSKFCRNIDKQASTLSMRDKIKTALAFYVTGRESEVSWLENKEATLRYKAAGADNFTAFAATQPYWEEDEIASFANLIKIGGIPGQDKKLKEQSERWIFHIMNMAHNLDLMRTVEASNMQKYIEIHGLSPTDESHCLVRNCEGARQHFAEINSMVRTSLTATGNRVFCKWENGKYVPSSSGYEPVAFIYANTNIELCFSNIEKQREYTKTETAVYTMLVDYYVGSFFAETNKLSELDRYKIYEKLLYTSIAVQGMTSFITILRELAISKAMTPTMWMAFSMLMGLSVEYTPLKETYFRSEKGFHVKLPEKYKKSVMEKVISRIGPELNLPNDVAESEVYRKLIEFNLQQSDHVRSDNISQDLPLFFNSRPGSTHQLITVNEPESEVSPLTLSNPASQNTTSHALKSTISANEEKAVPKNSMDQSDKETQHLVCAKPAAKASHFSSLFPLGFFKTKKLFKNKNESVEDGVPQENHKSSYGFFKTSKKESIKINIPQDIMTSESSSYSYPAMM